MVASARDLYSARRVADRIFLTCTFVEALDVRVGDVLYRVRRTGDPVRLTESNQSSQGGAKTPKPRTGQ